MAEGLSLREFGRQIGVTGEAVRKAVKTGKIPADCIQHDAKGWPRIVDPTRAAKAWGRNRDESQVRDKGKLAAGAKRGWAARRGEDPPDDMGEVAQTPAGAPLRAGAGVPARAESDAITAAYKARIAKLDYEERQGKLVNAEQVKVGFVNMVTTAKTRLLGVPSKAKSRIPTLTVRDIEALEDLIAEALEELSLGR